jgi:hypothetical protein
VESAYERAKTILSDNQDKLRALAESLLKNEVIFKEDVESILGARPFAPAEPLLPPAQEPVALEAPAAPDVDDAAPVVEGGTPAAEGAAPVVDGAAPVVDDAAPAGDEVHG